MAHTPRPWQKHDDDYCPNEIWGNLEGPLEDGHINGTFVCTVHTQCDGNLIVAAPDLLAALQWIADHGDVGSDGRPAFHDMRTHARKAIAKAEGGTNVPS